MYSMLDENADTLDEQEKKVIESIRKHGWFGHHVMAEDALPGFSYTTGFSTSLGQPEVIGFSLGQHAHDILWEIYNAMTAGKFFPIGERCDKVLASHDVMFLPVSSKYYRDHLGWNIWYYGGENFDCFQLVLPDKENRFPWEAGVETWAVEGQPDLTAGNWAGRKASH